MRYARPRFPAAVSSVRFLRSRGRRPSGACAAEALFQFNKPFLAWHAINVFCDRTNLSTSPGLWSSVQRELADSEFFVLLASTSSSQWNWVRREVDYFRQWYELWR